MADKPLEVRFQQLAQRLAIPSRAAQAGWELLRQNYTEPTRYYHNFEHLVSLFEAVDEAVLRSPDLRPQHPDLFELAVWFHDVIDERGNPQGVAQSAQQAVAFLEASAPFNTEHQQYLRQMVMATQHGAPLPVAAHPDAMLLADSDLSILGQAPDKYESYRDQIRREYKEVEETAYKAGRKNVLAMFAQRTPIYRTAYFHDKYESQAKANLAAEIELLSQ